MIWLILGIVFVLMCYRSDPEGDAMYYVGKTEYDKSKQSMTEKEFKKFVKEKSKLMQKAMNDAAEYHRKNNK